MAKTPSFMQRFGRQHVNGSKTMLRSAPNQFQTNLPFIWESRSRKRLVLVRSEFLGEFVNTLTVKLAVFSLESGEFMATSPNADILETDCLF